MFTDDDLGFFKDEASGGSTGKGCASPYSSDQRRCIRVFLIILLGHSMGSFVTRKYICDYGYELDGVIIMGTGHQPTPMVLVGKALADALQDL